MKPSNPIARFAQPANGVVFLGGFASSSPADPAVQSAVVARAIVDLGLRPVVRVIPDHDPAALTPTQHYRDAAVEKRYENAMRAGAARVPSWPAGMPPIVAAEVTPESRRILDGHHRMRAAVAADLTAVPVVTVDAATVAALQGGGIDLPRAHARKGIDGKAIAAWARGEAARQKGAGAVMQEAWMPELHPRNEKGEFSSEWMDATDASSLRPVNGGIGSFFDGDGLFFDSVIMPLHNRNNDGPIRKFAEEHPQEFAAYRRVALKQAWRDAKTSTPFNEWIEKPRPIFRGVFNDVKSAGKSWTFAKDVAVDFSRYGPGGDPRTDSRATGFGKVLEKSVAPKDIFFYSNEQGESEVLLQEHEHTNETTVPDRMPRFLEALIGGEHSEHSERLGEAWDEQEHPRDDAGRFSDSGGGTSTATADPSDADALTRDAGGAWHTGGKTYAPDPESDSNGDGVTDASRVGVAGDSVPTPPSIPRLPNLTADERDAESRFANAFEADPDGMAREYLDRLQAGTIDGAAPNVFATDDAKLLSPDYNPARGTDSQRMDARADNNLATHQTANAIAKRAFLMQLDDVATGPEEHRSVLITSGGVASGKDFALGKIPEAAAIAAKVGAVWNSAGEQNGTENPWVLAECEKRGLRPVFVFVNADPEQTWGDPKRGVIERAQRQGRMVTAKIFADSYAVGPRNFDAFQTATNAGTNAGKSRADFIVIDNRGTPKLLDRIPPESTRVDADELHARASKTLSDREGLRASVVAAGTSGDRIWGATAHAAR